MNNVSKLAFLVVFLSVFALIATPFYGQSSMKVKAQTPLISGTIIPLYTYPTDPTWTTVTNLKVSHPNVPIIVIANPNSGPGISQDGNFVNGINLLRAHGVIVVGYVPTHYGGRSLVSVERDISKYHSWYNVNGILFDEMSNHAGFENYYRTLNSYAKSLGLSHTIGNPGADVPSTYVGSVDTIIIYENQGYPSLTYLDGWHSQYIRNNWAMTSYGVPLNSLWIVSAKQYVGYIYVTNDVLPNPYDSLPSYFSTMISNLD